MTYILFEWRYRQLYETQYDTLDEAIAMALAASDNGDTAPDRIEDEHGDVVLKGDKLSDAMFHLWAKREKARRAEEAKRENER